jgi:hypothetical protein
MQVVIAKCGLLKYAVGKKEKESDVVSVGVSVAKGAERSIGGAGRFLVEVFGRSSEGRIIQTREK